MSSFFLPRDSPQWGRASSLTRFLDHTQRRTTVGRTPQQFEGYSSVFISTDSVQKCCPSCVLCKERGMGQGNLNRPPRNAIKSTQLCVVLLLERTLPCSQLEVSTELFDVNVYFHPKVYITYLSMDLIYMFGNDILHGAPLMIKVDLK